MNDPQGRHKFKLHMVILSFMAMSVQFRKKDTVFSQLRQNTFKKPLMEERMGCVSHLRRYVHHGGKHRTVRMRNSSSHFESF